MNYSLIRDVLKLIEEFDNLNQEKEDYSNDIESFKHWVAQSSRIKKNQPEPDWEGKDKGRGSDSVINTLIVHMNRYAKSYSKAAIFGSDFTSQEDFIYLINLQAFGEMTKMDLTKKNVHEKPTGILIINRLIKKKWLSQS